MRRAAIGLVVLGLALASCGDDADPEAATTTTRRVVTESQVGTTSIPASGPTTTAIDNPLECESVGFTPNSEDVASSIRAIGLSCMEAEAFVGIAGRLTSSGGPQELDVEGYHCVRTGSEQDPLPRSFYECTNGPKTITFVRS